MTDPKVYTELSEIQDVEATGGYMSLVAGLNDEMILDVDGISLVGSTDLERGPAKKITVMEPLLLDDQQLKLNFDIESLQEQVDGLGADLATAYTAISNVETAMEDESAARIGADNALDARLDIIEARIPTPLANFVNDSAAAAGGVAVGGFYRFGSTVLIRIS